MPATSGGPPGPAGRASPLAEFLHFFGEVEVVSALGHRAGFAILLWHGFGHGGIQYFNHPVNYTEPIFVVVIMALERRGRVVLAESGLRRVARLGRETPAAWWLTILTIGPILGSFITEPGRHDHLRLLLGRRSTHRQAEPDAEVRPPWAFSS